MKNYVLACSSIGLGAGIVFGISTMHNLMLTDCEITEKENENDAQDEEESN